MHARLRRSAVALLGSTLVAGTLAASPAATAVATGAITGTITGAGAGPLPEVQVDLYQWDDAYEYWAYVDSTVTDEAGHYSWTSEIGDYRVGFEPYSDDYVTEYYDDAPDVDEGTTVTVSSAAPYVADAELARAGHITGVVTDLQGDPASMPVLALRKTGDGAGTQLDLMGAAIPDSETGAYDIGGLSDGTYRIGFSPFVFGGTAWAAEWFDDQVSPYGAQDVVVSGGQTVSGIDAQLAPAATIAGTVTDAGDEPLQYAQVTAWSKVGRDWVPANFASTDADGHYVMPSVAASTYRLSFEIWDSETGAYVGEYWQDKGRLENATNVPVAVGQEVTGIDAQLVEGEHDAETVPTVENLTLPTISGAPVVGSTLTASTGTWSPDPTEYYYEWLRDGEFIMGSYGSTYVPTAEDAGHTISVFITAIADDHEAGHAMSAATAAVAQPVVTPPVVTPPVVMPPVVDVPAALASILKSVKIAGKPEVGKTVRLKGLDASFRTAVTYKLQWYAGAKKIKKATKSKLKITSAMKGKKISVKVTATAAGSKASKKLILGKAR